MCRTKIICNDGSPIYPSICNANSFFTWILRLVLFCKQPQRCNKAKRKKIKRIDSHTKRSIIINMYIPVYEIGIRDEYDKCAHTHTHIWNSNAKQPPQHQHWPTATIWMIHKYIAAQRILFQCVCYYASARARTHRANRAKWRIACHIKQKIINFRVVVVSFLLGFDRDCFFSSFWWVVVWNEGLLQFEIDFCSCNPHRQWCIWFG